MVSDILFFLFFLFFRGKTKKTKNKMSDTMSGQLLEGWSMVSDILFFFVFFGFSRFLPAHPQNQYKTKPFKVLCEFKFLVHQQPFDFISSSFSSHWMKLIPLPCAAAKPPQHLLSAPHCSIPSSIDNIPSSLQTLRYMRSNDMDWEMDEE